MELNIVIRTLLHVNERVYVQSGAGIVIDSLPEKEFYESLNKAKALWKAVEISEQRLRTQQS
jgi:para-aminobenzoate synthetase component 1